MSNSGELISKALSFVIFAGAFGLKIPQILKIVSAKSVEGLSRESIYTDVPLVLTSIMYNYLTKLPLEKYAESVVVLLQNLVLVALVWSYSKPATKQQEIALVLTMFVAVAAVSFNAPPEYQFLLPMSNLPMLMYSRFIQIYKNFRDGSTGNLDFTQFFLQFAGSFARIFTIVQPNLEKQDYKSIDWYLIMPFIVGGITSGVLCAQVFDRKVFFKPPF